MKTASLPLLDPAQTDPRSLYRVTSYSEHGRYLYVQRTDGNHESRCIKLNANLLIEIQRLLRAHLLRNPIGFLIRVKPSFSGPVFEAIYKPKAKLPTEEPCESDLPLGHPGKRTGSRHVYRAPDATGDFSRHR